MKMRALLLVALAALFGNFTAGADTPRVTTGAFPDTVRVGETFPVPVEIRWTGAPQDISITSLSLGNAPDVTTGEVAHSKKASGGETTHTVTTEVTLTVPGEHVLGPFTVNYRDAEGTALSLDVPGTITVQALPEGGLGTRWLGLVLVLGLVSGSWVWRRYQQRPPKAPPPPLEPTVTERLDRCKAYAQSGAIAYALDELAAIKDGLPAADDPLPPKKVLEEEAAKVRYGGFSGDRHQLNRWIRAVEVASRASDSTTVNGGDR